MKRLILMASVAVLGALAFAGAALAQTTAPTAPDIDVYAYFAGIVDALDANLTALLGVMGLMAGTFLILGLIRRGRRG